MRSNTTEWSSEITLITVTTTADSEGYETTSETRNTVFCNFSLGVSRAEFYDGNKAGHQLSAEAEIYYFDYSGERLAEINGIRYSVVRQTPLTLDTVLLILEEVER